MFEIGSIKKEFPIFNTHKSLSYLDSAATAQCPQVVIDRLSQFYSCEKSNIHRGVYALSANASQAYEDSREVVRKYLNAQSLDEIVFLRGVTEGINLLSSVLAPKLNSSSEILISEMEHHSNIVPWQIISQTTGAKLKVVPVDDNGELCLETFEGLLNANTKIISIAHASNTLGTINPIKQITKLAHDKGALVVVDGAQVAQHQKVDVRDIDCDFYVFSGHKAYGPTGIGVLFGKKDVLNSLSPYQVGGGMISSVEFDNTTFKQSPYRFEAGTPNIAGAIGLAKALEFIESVGLDAMAKHQAQLVQFAKEQLSKVEGLRLLANPSSNIGVLSFVMDVAHAHDVGTILDTMDIAIRTGHHCAQPLMKRFGVPSTVRASFGVYNTEEDVVKLCDGLCRVKEIFS